MSRLRVAVTGAGGRIGSALVSDLGSREEFDVVAIVRNAITAHVLGPVNAEIRVGSVVDPTSSRALLADCDAVINCALAKGWPSAARRENEAVIRNIANTPGVRVAVHFSSVEVYGRCMDQRRSTFERPRPDSSYGVDKLGTERLAIGAFNARGIRPHVVRMGHVYGPSQWVSLDALQRIGDPSFALPFGGDIPSNAVSIRTVAAAVTSMLNGDQPAGIRNLIDWPQTTWRALYDLHSGLIHAPSAGSLSESVSRMLRDEHYAAAKRPFQTVAHAARSVLGSLDPIALAKLDAFRRVVHGPLLLLPARIGQVASRVYLRRKVRSAVRRVRPSEPPVPGFLCAQEVPGPCYEAAASPEATAAMSEDLQTWLRGMSSYRWDPVSMGLGQTSINQPRALKSVG